MSLALAALGVYVIVLNPSGKSRSISPLGGESNGESRNRSAPGNAMALEAKVLFFPLKKAESSLRLALSGFQDLGADGPPRRSLHRTVQPQRRASGYGEF